MRSPPNRSRAWLAGAALGALLMTPGCLRPTVVVAAARLVEPEIRVASQEPVTFRLEVPVFDARSCENPVGWRLSSAPGAAPRAQSVDKVVRALGRPDALCGCLRGAKDPPPVSLLVDLGEDESGMMRTQQIGGSSTLGTCLAESMAGPSPVMAPGRIRVRYDYRWRAPPARTIGERLATAKDDFESFMGASYWSLPPAGCPTERDLRRALAGRRADFERCRERGGGGQIAALVRIASDGQLESTQISQSSADPRLENCVLEALRGLRLSACPEGDPLEVEYGWNL